MSDRDKTSYFVEALLYPPAALSRIAGPKNIKELVAGKQYLDKMFEKANLTDYNHGELYLVYPRVCDKFFSGIQLQIWDYFSSKTNENIESLVRTASSVKKLEQSINVRSIKVTKADVAIYLARKTMWSWAYEIFTGKIEEKQLPFSQIEVYVIKQLVGVIALSLIFYYERRMFDIITSIKEEIKEMFEDCESLDDLKDDYITPLKVEISQLRIEITELQNQKNTLVDEIVNKVVEKLTEILKPEGD